MQRLPDCDRGARNDRNATGNWRTQTRTHARTLARKSCLMAAGADRKRPVNGSGAGPLAAAAKNLAPADFRRPKLGRRWNSIWLRAPLRATCGRENLFISGTGQAGGPIFQVGLRLSVGSASSSAGAFRAPELRLRAICLAKTQTLSRARRPLRVCQHYWPFRDRRRTPTRAVGRACARAKEQCARARARDCDRTLMSLGLICVAKDQLMRSVRRPLARAPQRKRTRRETRRVIAPTSGRRASPIR